MEREDAVAVRRPPGIVATCDLNASSGPGRRDASALLLAGGRRTEAREQIVVEQDGNVVTILEEAERGLRIQVDARCSISHGPSR